MSAADDALDVARFCWPADDFCLCAMDRLRRKTSFISSAERVLVERGLGEEYARALIAEIHPEFHIGCWSWKTIAAIRTAPLEVCLRALARVVREQQQKEKA